MKCIITLTIIFFKKNIVFRCYPSLQAAVDDARTNDVVLIPSGIHSLLNINALSQGGTLMGMNLYSICYFSIKIQMCFPQWIVPK